MGRTCPHCGCGEIDEDAARGDATCTGCGTVLEESIVVSENQFQERAGGSGHTLVGQFVSMERAQTHTLQGVPGLASQESREVTFQKGRKLIEEVGSQLRINQHCVDTAFNFFKMCVSRNLTRGRVRSHVVASCMYMTCRLENTAHLLLDFSDVTQVNVFDLGRTLSFLSRSLKINLPTTDPCLYIMRFACMLELGDKQKEVVNLATRLVQRMKRDWMSTGRRPTGLCGAALLIAARAFNFNRSIPDVVKIVHISESVVRKRLEEFSQTPSGALTIDEFSTVDLEHNEDPPAFREARKKAREDQIRDEDMIAAKMEKELQPIEEELEKALEKKRREKFKNTPYAKLIGDSLDLEVGKAEATLVRNNIIDSVYEAADAATTSSATPEYSQYRPTLQSLGITPSTTSPVLQKPVVNQTDDLPLSDIDDDEIESYILTDAEAALKEKFWMKNNGEHLKEMERRKKERAEQDEKDKDNPNKKRRRNTTTNRGSTGNSTAHGSAVEAMEKIIHEKKLSNKVNYEILKEIGVSATPKVCKEEKVANIVITNATSSASSISQANDELNSVFTSIASAVSASKSNESPLLSRHERDLKRKNASASSVNLGVLNKIMKTSDAPIETKATSNNTTTDSNNKEKKPLLALRGRAGRVKPIIRPQQPANNKSSTEVSRIEETPVKSSVEPTDSQPQDPNPSEVDKQPESETSKDTSSPPADDSPQPNNEPAQPKPGALSRRTKVKANIPTELLRRSSRR